MEKEKIIKEICKNIPIDFEVISNRPYPLLIVAKKVPHGHCTMVLTNLRDRKINNLFGSIYFNEIESLIKPNYDLIEDSATIMIGAHYKLFKYPQRTRILKQLPITLQTPEDLEVACNLIRTFIHEDALPFFEYWQDIRDFLPFIETDDSIFVNTLLGHNGVFRKIIIWHLTSHPKFGKFTNELVNSYRTYLKEEPDDHLSKRSFKLLKKILKKLETITPKYEWDESYLEKKPFKLM